MRGRGFWLQPVSINEPNNNAKVISLEYAMDDLLIRKPAS